MPDKYLATRRRNAADRREWLDTLKQRPCADCGATFPPYVMDWDHVRGEKLFNLAAARTRNRESVLQEIEKCDLVCANCHRERTYQRQNAESLDSA